MYVYRVGPESLPPTSQCSCILFGNPVSFPGGLRLVLFVCLEIPYNADWPGSSKGCWYANKEFKFVLYHSALNSKHFLTPYIINLYANMNFEYLVYL